ncbi:hypothetical protein LCGC14_2860920, partial [marine sediment metagenome]
MPVCPDPLKHAHGSIIERYRVLAGSSMPYRSGPLTPSIVVIPKGILIIPGLPVIWDSYSQNSL